jgi:glutaredoxin
MIIIYGKPHCPFCEKAKQFCEIRQISYEYREMDTDYTREELLETFPGSRTVPQIVVNGLKVGGYDGLLKYVEETNFTGSGFTL